MAAGSHLSGEFLPPGGLLGGRRTIRFKLLKSQRNVIGVDGMSFLSPDGGSRPASLSIVHGLSPADLPAIRFQLFNNGFPILRHLLWMLSPAHEAGFEANSSHTFDLAGYFVIAIDQANGAGLRPAFENLCSSEGKVFDEHNAVSIRESIPIFRCAPIHRSFRTPGKSSRSSGDDRTRKRLIKLLGERHATLKYVGLL